MVPEVALVIINLVLVLLVAAAMVTDVRCRRIPNWQTVPAIGLGVVLNCMWAGQTGLLASLGGGIIGAGLLIIPYLLGGIGAGDVKLLAAIGALKGWPFVLWTAWYAALIGGLLGILILVKKRSVLRLLRYLLSLPLGCKVAALVPHRVQTILGFAGEGTQKSLSLSLPYGLAIALGTFGALYLQYLH
ncbi:MAG: A24 family peptidase [Chloroflexota bacterium]